MAYVGWILLTLLYNFVVCVIAVKVGPRDFWKNYLLISASGLIPTWALASYFSKNLVFDGLLFDAILVLTTPIFLALLGQADGFYWYNWLGVVLVVIGLLLVKIHPSDVEL